MAFLSRTGNYDLSIPKEIELDWKSTVDIINKYSANELQPIEEYRMVFSTDGKSISLKSQKHGGFPVALLFLRKEKIAQA